MLSFVEPCWLLWLGGLQTCIVLENGQYSITSNENTVLRSRQTCTAYCRRLACDRNQLQPMQPPSGQNCHSPSWRSFGNPSAINCQPVGDRLAKTVQKNRRPVRDWLMTGWRLIADVTEMSCEWFGDELANGLDSFKGFLPRGTNMTMVSESYHYHNQHLWRHM